MRKVRSQLGRLQSASSFRLKEAVVALYRKDSSEGTAALREFSDDDWQKIVYWLDISGMTLYLLEEMCARGIEKTLPVSVLAKLETNLFQNRARTTTLLEEAKRVVGHFNEEHLPLAILKGVTLMPHSVRDCVFRWQADLDILVAVSEADCAIRCLIDLGYAQHAVSGSTVEFRGGSSDVPSLANIYKPSSQKVVELHLLSRTEDEDRLSRVECRDIYGVALPSLSTPDIFVQQTIHLLKHLCGEHTRLSWLLELCRMIDAKSDDAEFWRAVKAIATAEEQGGVALGVSLLLAKDIFAVSAPSAIEEWALCNVPPGVHRWVRRYGREILFADSTGSKLYLILRQQLSTRKVVRRQMWKALIPVHMPWPILKPSANEHPMARLARYRAECGFFCHRLRFHIVEGLRVVIELVRWQCDTVRSES